MQNKFLWLVFGLSVLWIVVTRFMGKVAPAKARELVKSGALLLDVRSPGEFSGGHIDGAENVPVNELGARAAQWTDKARPIVVYCASGMRSAAAKKTLLAEGFRDVHDLGAMNRWG